MAFHIYFDKLAQVKSNQFSCLRINIFDEIGKSHKKLFNLHSMIIPTKMKFECVLKVQITFIAFRDRF